MNEQSEAWKSIGLFGSGKGCRGKKANYEVSSLGRARNSDTNELVELANLGRQKRAGYELL